MVVQALYPRCFIPQARTCSRFIAQGFSIPKAWYDVPEGFSKSAWLKNIYAAKGKLLSLAL